MEKVATVATVQKTFEASELIFIPGLLQILRKWSCLCVETAIFRVGIFIWVLSLFWVSVSLIYLNLVL